MTRAPKTYHSVLSDEAAGAGADAPEGTEAVAAGGVNGVEAGVSLGDTKSCKTEESTALATSTVAVKVSPGESATLHEARMLPSVTLDGSGSNVIKPDW